VTDRNCFEDYVLFSAKNAEAGRVPRRCTLCGGNPAVFQYQKHKGSHPARRESGSCCTACAFNMLLRNAEQEARESAGLANI
jgi:hypothetical protein